MCFAASSSPDIIIVDEEPPRSRRNAPSTPRQKGAPQRAIKPANVVPNLPPVQTLSPGGLSGSKARQVVVPGSQQIVVQQPFTQFVSNTGMTLMARPALGVCRFCPYS